MRPDTIPFEELVPGDLVEVVDVGEPDWSGTANPYVELYAADCLQRLGGIPLAVVAVSPPFALLQHAGALPARVMLDSRLAAVRRCSPDWASHFAPKAPGAGGARIVARWRGNSPDPGQKE